MAIDKNPSPKKAPPRSQEGQLANTSPLTTVGLVMGVVGFSAVIFGVLLYALAPGVAPLAIGNVVFGLVCLVFRALTDRGGLARMLSARSAPLWGLEVATALGVLGGLFAVNWVAHKNTVEWDLTQDGIYTLHPQSIAVAKRLDKPIKVYAFYGPDESTRGSLDQAIELYRMHTDNLAIEHVDPDRAPSALLKRFDINDQSARIVFADESASDDQNDWGRFTKIKRPTEEAMTNAIIELAERRQRKAYFLTGHGEPSIEDQLSSDGLGPAATLLGNEGLAVETLSLIGRSDVPEDATLIILVGPKTALLPNEAEALKVFLDRGGRALVLLEPGPEHGLDRVFRPYGVVVGNDLIIDDNPAARSLGFGADAPVIQRYEAHPITSVMGNAFTMFFRARSVSPRLSLANISVSTLVQSSPDSFGETDWLSDSEPNQGEEDLAGPVPIAVASTRRTAVHPQMINQEARLVVFGDFHFATNRFMTMTGNANLFVNTVNWLAGDEDRITIRPPKKAGDRLALTERQQYGIMFFSVNLLPLLIVGVGFSVRAIRRRK